MGSRLGAKNTQVKQGKCSALAAKQQKSSRMHIYHTRKIEANYSTLYKRAKEGQLPLTFFFACFKDFFLWLFFGRLKYGTEKYCISRLLYFFQNYVKTSWGFPPKKYGSFLYSPLSFFFGKSFYFSVFSVLVWEWRATNQLIRSHPPTAASPPKKEREKGGERNSLECFGRANAATVHVNSDLW